MCSSMSSPKLQCGTKGHLRSIKPLPHKEVLDLSQHRHKVWNLSTQDSNARVNFVEKRKTPGYQYFLVLPQCFQVFCSGIPNSKIMLLLWTE